MHILNPCFLVLSLALGCTNDKSSDTSADLQDGEVETIDGGPDDGSGAGDGDIDADADAGDADDGMSADEDGTSPDGFDADADGMTDQECTEEAELALYERYIEPLVTDAHPSNCNSCHLSGIDPQLNM